MITELQLREPNFIDYIGAFIDSFRSFFGWWYGDLPLTILALLKRTLIILNDTTSFSIVLFGLFSPWKNDYNIAGWLVGLTIKLIYLPIILTLFVTLVILFISLLLLQLAILPTVIGLIIINPFLTP